MSAGVAVAFKNNFGRPSISNFVHSHLTYQKADDSTSVYELVTKGRYNGKPTRDDYNLAFDQLTIHFVKNQMKTLICSPMGCGRDKISLNQFATNIVKFKRFT